MNIDLIHLDLTDSTNNWAKEHAKTFHPDHFTCITALEQTAGRGRHQRKWISPRGSNLYLSVFFTLPCYESYIGNLGQIMALSCYKMLLDQKIFVKLKWPNDLLINYRKVAGILTETVALEEKIGVIIGIGINVNMSFKDQLLVNQPVTSLCEWTTLPLDPLNLVIPLMSYFSSDLQMLKQQGFSHFLPEIQKCILYQNEKITVKLADQTIEGFFHSILDDGSLKLTLASGQYQVISAGEIMLSSFP